MSIVEAMICQKPVIVTNIWALNTFERFSLDRMVKELEVVYQEVLQG